MKGFAHVLGLESHQSVWQMQQKPTRQLRSGTLEALLEITGYETEEELDGAWRGGMFPEIDGVRDRIERRLGGRGTLPFLDGVSDPAAMARGFERFLRHPYDVQADTIAHLSPRSVAALARLFTDHARFGAVPPIDPGAAQTEKGAA